MCGISGYYSTNGVFKEEELFNMSNAMQHRGPDAHGMAVFNGCGIAHRRLSIIDLSEHANQPMKCSSGRHWIVYNGEVYNYEEIAREMGFNLLTSSDTEIVLETFVKWKHDSYDMFNGMFAFAVYDKEEKLLTIVRDRLGIKPLFYYWDGENLAFASELKSLLKLSHVRKNARVNHEAVNQFLHLGYIPEPNSIYSNIYKLPAGSYATFNGKELEIKHYWSPEMHVSESVITDFYQAKEILRDLVEASVRYRLKSDVDFGTFLSGGIDSSLVTAFAQRNLRSRLKTFSIGFADSKHNESKYAAEVAKYLGTDHHELMVTEKDAIDLVPSLLDSYDEPFADSSAIPTMLVSKMAREHVTMTLSGDGGDELFHGYGAYSWAERLNSGVYRNFRKPLSVAFSLMNSRYKRISKLLSYESEEYLRSHIFSQEQYLYSRKELEQLLLLNNKKVNGLTEQYQFHNREFSPAEAQAFFDIKYYLKDDLLTKVDRASMKYSLEARVPLLDYNIVEFALNVSPELKTKNGVQKYLLKELLYDYVPSSLFDRPKWGFSIPLSKWLKGELSYLLEEFVNEDMCIKHGFINSQNAMNLKRKYLSGKYDYLYNRLWLIIVLHQFLEKEAMRQ